jgi:hypothetical protein
MKAKAHILKTDPDFFAAVKSGKKKFEIRKDDRNYQCGDYLILRETKASGAEMADGAPLEYTGEVLVARVTYIMHIEAKFGNRTGPTAVMSLDFFVNPENDWDERRYWLDVGILHFDNDFKDFKYWVDLDNRECSSNLELS